MFVCRVAKDKNARIWKDYTAPTETETKENFTAKVSNTNIRIRIFLIYTKLLVKNVLAKGSHAFFIVPMFQVVECVNGDGLMVKKSDGAIRKIFLASIRPPR